MHYSYNNPGSDIKHVDLIEQFGDIRVEASLNGLKVDLDNVSAINDVSGWFECLPLNETLNPSCETDDNNVLVNNHVTGVVKFVIWRSDPIQLIYSTDVGWVAESGCKTETRCLKCGDPECDHHERHRRCRLVKASK